MTFFKLKMSLSGNFVLCLHFCQVHFTILQQIQYENNFLPTSLHRQRKVRRFLGICLYDCFIYGTNFVFRKCLETRRHLCSGRKTVNRDFKQRERGRRQEPQTLRENPYNHLRMTGGKKFDVLRSAPTWNESLWRWLKTWVSFRLLCYLNVKYSRETI